MFQMSNMSQQNNHRIIQFQKDRVSGIDPSMIERILWIDGFQSGKRWLDRMVKPTRTHEVYLYQFERFCKFVKMSPDELLKLYTTSQIEFLTQQTPNFVIQDLMTLQIPLMKMKDGTPVTPSTQRQTQIAISSFFRANGFPLHFTFAVTHVTAKRLPTIQELNEMLALKINYKSRFSTELYFARNQALISFFASTGFRPETVSLLKWLDLKPTNNDKIPIVIVVAPDRMKGRGASQRYTFTYQTSFLHEKAYGYLMNYKAMIKPKDDDALFAKYPETQKMKSLSPMGLWQVFDDVSTALWNGQKKYACNSFRHFVNNAYVFAEIVEIDRLSLTGHASTNIEKFYVRVDPNNPIQDPKIQDLMRKFESALAFLI